MDILTIVAGIMIGFIVAKNVIFHKKNNRQRNRQIITISAALTIVFNIVSYIIYKKNRHNYHTPSLDNNSVYLAIERL